MSTRTTDHRRHPDPAQAEPQRSRPASPARRPARVTVLALVLLVVAASAAMRVVNLSVFPTLVFDEYFYVHDANLIIHGRTGPSERDPWKPGASRSLAQPPAGTLAIAAGILALGNDPWGWRLPSAIAGTLLIALVYPLARRLGLGPRWALLALCLAASDTMLIAESRVGVLDPFVALWSAVCVYCALRYVQSGRPTRWLVLTGVSGGFAIASKWSGGLAVVAAVAIIIGDRLLERRAARDGDLVPRPLTTRSLARATACLVALLVGVYVASYAWYFAAGHTLGQWLHLQSHLTTSDWAFRAPGAADMASPPISWILDLTPLWYRWTLTSGHRAVAMIAIGNPLLFWGAVPAFIALLWLACRNRDPRPAAIPLLVAILYLPWLLTTRQSYIYYITPVVPFLAIMVAAALARLSGETRVRAGWAVLLLVIGALTAGAAAGGTTSVRIAALAALGGVVAVRLIAGRGDRGPRRSRGFGAVAAGR